MSTPKLPADINGSLNSTAPGSSRARLRPKQPCSCSRSARQPSKGQQAAGRVRAHRTRHLPVECVLGIGWDCTTDDYHLRVKSVLCKLLSTLFRSFDPFGLCFPVITNANLLSSRHASLVPSSPLSRLLDGTSVCPRISWESGVRTPLRLTHFLSCALSGASSPITFSSTYSPSIRWSSVAQHPLLLLKLLLESDLTLSKFTRPSSWPKILSPLTVPHLELQPFVLAVSLASIKKEFRICISTVEFYTGS